MFRFSKNQIDELFVNLKVLGKVEPGDKLIVAGRIWVLDKFRGIQTTFYRWWHRESRQTTTEALQNLLELTFTTLNNLEANMIPPHNKAGTSKYQNFPSMTCFTSGWVSCKEKCILVDTYMALTIIKYPQLPINPDVTKDGRN